MPNLAFLLYALTRACNSSPPGITCCSLKLLDTVYNTASLHRWPLYGERMVQLAHPGQYLVMLTRPQLSAVLDVLRHQHAERGSEDSGHYTVAPIRVCAEPIKSLRAVTWPCCTHKNFINLAFTSVHHANLWQKTDFSDLKRYSYHNMLAEKVWLPSRAFSGIFWSVYLEQLHVRTVALIKS